MRVVVVWLGLCLLAARLAIYRFDCSSGAARRTRLYELAKGVGGSEPVHDLLTSRALEPQARDDIEA